jgi:hypothetical protein
MPYLECEDRDALHLTRECERIFANEPYRRQLDDLLLSGWIGAKPRPARPRPPTPDAGSVGSP